MSNVEHEIPRRPLIIHEPRGLFIRSLLIFRPWNWIIRVSPFHAPRPPVFVHWLITRGQGFVFRARSLPRSSLSGFRRVVVHCKTIPSNLTVRACIYNIITLKKKYIYTCKDHNLPIWMKLDSFDGDKMFLLIDGVIIFIYIYAWLTSKTRGLKTFVGLNYTQTHTHI